MKLLFLVLFIFTITSCDDDEVFVEQKKSPPPVDRIEDPIKVNPCRIILNQSYLLDKDIHCNDNSNQAITIIGNNITIDGNGHQVFTNPNHKVAVLVQGNNITIKNLKIVGNTNQIGLLAHNVKTLKVDNLNASNLAEGIVYTADPDFPCKAIQLKNSLISSNELHGLRVNAPNCVKINNITNNDFSMNNYYALNLNAKIINLHFNDSIKNDYRMSQNGLKLRAKENLTLKGINLKDQNILGEKIYIDHTKKATLMNNIIGGDFIGLSIHVYDVEDILIKNNTLYSEEFAIKIANDIQKSKISIINNEIKGQEVAGILLTNFSDTIFNSVIIKNNSFINNALPIVDYSNSDFKDIQD